MNLKVASIDELHTPPVRAQMKEVRKMVDEFWESGNQIMRVEYEEGEYVSVSSAKASFMRAMASAKYNAVTIVKNGKLYLVRLSNMK